MGRNHKAAPRRKLARALGAAAMVALSMFGAAAKAEAGEEGLPQLFVVIEPLRPGITGQ